jgi:hypothetical protein
MRDRLIELLKEAKGKCKDCGDCVGYGKGDLCGEYLKADHLLANGVIVPPCKVGETVYLADLENKSVWYGNLVSYSLDAAHLWFNCHYKCGLNIWHPIEDFGKTVFLTKEEAEKELERRKK